MAPAADARPACGSSADGRAGTGEPTPFLIALEQCGLELQAPHMRTPTKRRIETADVDAATLAERQSPVHGLGPGGDGGVVPRAWIRTRRTSSRRSTSASATSIATQSMTSRGIELHPPIALAKGTATVVRFAVPPAAFADGTLEVRVERIVGPDVVMSELRLFSSEPPRPDPHRRRRLGAED